MIQIQALREILNSQLVPNGTLLDTLNDFKCERDEDIECFLYKHSINYEEQNIARTFLIMDDAKPGVVIGYFAIGLNVMHFDTSLSVQDAYEGINLCESGFHPVYKLFMIGKDDRYKNFVNMKDIFFGDVLRYINECQDKVGGEIFYIDCDPNLQDYYDSLGFEYLDEIKDKDLIRMIMKI